ncbi:MAG: long-chain fatty acid--CoA ligase [Spirochaetaceae bacterium]|nr:MAG: long-chain fatty acid--CoA ligase [Spirochaetaceae bacterium]
MKPTIPLTLQEIARTHGDYPAQMLRRTDRPTADQTTGFATRTYAELRDIVERCAAGLLSLGIERGDHVGLVAENRGEWLVADLATLSIGAADVPRGNDTPANELAYILDYADCSTAFVEDAAQVRKIVSTLERTPKLTRLITFLDTDARDTLVGELTAESGAAGSVEILTLDEVEERGRELLESRPDAVADFRERGEADDVATLIFTSGTTGTPKGVMLTHDNFLHQVRHVPDLIEVGAGDIWLCVLPVWHSFERIMQYVAIGSASCLAYSKPVGHVMLADLQTVRPTWMASVPRIWEAVQTGIYRNVKTQSAVKQALFRFFVAIGSAHARLDNKLRGRLPRFARRSRVADALTAIVPWLALYPLRALGGLLVFSKIRQKLGGRFVAGISGGGALPPGVDAFFQAAGILLLEGYGLTETGPVLAVRAQRHPVAGTVGPVFPETQITIVDDAGAPLPPGKQGLIMARGPQVMKGYYKQPELTASVLNADGWINTGDLGMLTHDNELRITGRAKDTIVLRGGENVEPLPIEQKLQESELIDHAILQGQDQRNLGLLIVPNPDAVLRLAVELGIVDGDSAYDVALLADDAIRARFAALIRETVSAKNGFRAFERIGPFALIPGPLAIGDELSQKQEVKRHVVASKYADQIAALFE